MAPQNQLPARDRMFAGSSSEASPSRFPSQWKGPEQLATPLAAGPSLLLLVLTLLDET